MIIIVCQRLLKNTKISGITLFPFILLREKKYRQNKTLINHEKIHIRQQMELLIIPFYIWYLSEYYLKYLRYRNPQLAYRNISFEREAYANEQDLNYLKKRKFWSFISYIRFSKDMIISTFSKSPALQYYILLKKISQNIK